MRGGERDGPSPAPGGAGRKGAPIPLSPILLAAAAAAAAALSISLGFLLLAYLGGAAFGAVTSVSSKGYMISPAGEVSSTDFVVQAVGPTGMTPVRLYFSDPALAKYFSMSSESAAWNGAGFLAVNRSAAFSVHASEIDDESLFFRNHTVWVEVAGLNRTMAFFIVPGPFISRGKIPPTGVSVGHAVRQAVMDKDGRKIPVGVEVWVW